MVHRNAHQDAVHRPLRMCKNSSMASGGLVYAELSDAMAESLLSVWYKDATWYDIYTGARKGRLA